MNLGNRVTIALLGCLVSFNLLLRYPTSGHEVDVDSYFIHALTGAIRDNGHAEWTISPLSYFGWYPLSYPSAGPFALAGISDVSGTSVETAILIMTLLLGPIGILGAFVMAREVRRDDTFALSTAFLYGIAPRFLSITLWTASTRNLFTALLPIFIWTLLLTYRNRSRPALVVLVLISATLAATHRLVILIMVVVAAFVAALMLLVLLRVLRIQFPKLFLRSSMRRAIPHLALAAVVLTATGTLLGTDILGEYSQGEIVSGSDLPSQLANLSISIARSAGLALPLALVGLPVMTRQKYKTVAQPFLALTLLGLVPTLFLRKYTGFYILPFLTIFGALGIAGIQELWRRRRLLRTFSVIAVIVAASGFSTYVLGVEIQRIPVLDDDTYSTGLYVLHLGAPGTMVSNDGFTGVRVAAVAGVRVLPVGGAGTTFQNPELLAYGFYNHAEVSGVLVQVPITQLTIESDSLWTVSGIQAELDWTVIEQSAYWEIPAGLDGRYTPAYYLESNAVSGSFAAYNNVYCSNLGRSAHAAAYAIFQNGVQDVWWIRTASRSPPPGATFSRCP